MKKYLKQCVLLIIFFFSVFFKVSAKELLKYDNNPLKITYDLNFSENIQAHIYKENDKYKGILTSKRPSDSYYSLISIDSLNGVDWRMDKVIIDLGKDVDGRLFINKENNQRKILFAKMDSTDLYRIYGINCDQDLNCDQTPYLILDKSNSDPSENHGVFSPFLLTISDTYNLFYGAWGSKGFITKLAYSDHFGDWQRCPAEILSDSDGAYAYLKDGLIHLFVHNSIGIREMKTSSPISCSSVWENLGYIVKRNQPYDQNLIVFPSIVFDGSNNLRLYYSGKGIDNVWHLNLASEYPIAPTPTSTTTLTPIPTPTNPPFPTSTPISLKKPIVILPGTFASWDGDAILHNKTTNQSNWHLLPFVKEYSGLIETLKNLGYEENKNIYIFAYDWRKPIAQLVSDLDKYLVDQKIVDRKFYLVGHSLGGVIARNYAQKYHNVNLSKVVTIGSPHQGAVQSYKAVEAGEIDQDNSWLWLSHKLILQLYRNGLKTDRQILNENFPIAKDLFPTFNFLQDKEGNWIDYLTLNIKNDYFIDINEDINDSFNDLQTLAGVSIKTLSGYTIKDRTQLDRLLGNFIDGRPNDILEDSGDGIVLKKSASLENQTIELDKFNHGEIIYKINSLKSILDSLDISYSDNDIIEGRGTTISPSLIFLIRSPARMQVRFGENIFDENDGIIFIENAESGDYKLLVKGRERGKYEVIVGELGVEGNSWNIIEGDITSLIPQTEIDDYDIAFNSTLPNKYFIDHDDPIKLINELILILKNNEKNNREIISDFERVKKYYKSQKFNKIPALLFEQNEDLIEKKEYFELEKLENVYASIIKNNPKLIKILNNRANELAKKFLEKQAKLLKTNKLKPNNPKLVILEQIKKKFNTFDSSMANGQYSYVEIMLESASNLIRKL